MSLATARIEDKELADIWTDFKANGNIEARNRLLEHYLPVVRLSAERLHSKLPNHVDVEDLFSFGTSGLMGAVESFEPARKIRFETYCGPRIRGAMLDGLRSMDWAPRLVRSRAKKLERAMHQLKSTLGRTPMISELAGELGMSMVVFRRMYKDAIPVEINSLDDILGEDRNGRTIRVEHVVGDNRTESPERATLREDLRNFLTRELNRTERLVIMLYYYEGMSMKEIGKTFDLSESRVCQIHSAAITSLKQRFGGVSISSILAGEAKV